MCYDKMYVNTQRSIVFGRSVNCTTTSRDGKRVASGGWDGRVVIWDALSGRKVHAPKSGHGGKWVGVPGKTLVNSVCFSHDGRRVASGGDDGRVVIWDALSGKQVHALEGGHGGRSVKSVCFSGNGGRVASGGDDGRVVIWDISDEDPLNWKHVIWETLSGEQVHALQGGHADYAVIYSVCFSGDGGRVASGGEDGRVVIWDTSSGEQLHALGGGNASDSESGSESDSDGGSDDEGSHGSEPVTRVCFSSDGGRVASGYEDGRVMIWNALNGKQVHALDGGEWVESVCFSEDGTRVASAANDGRVLIWDAVSGKQVQAMYGIMCKSVTFLDDTNDICCVRVQILHQLNVNGNIKNHRHQLNVDVWRETEYTFESLYNASSAKRQRFGQKQLPKHVMKHIFETYVSPRDQQSLAGSNYGRVVIKTTNQVLSKEKGLWCVDDGTQLPKVIRANATAASAAPADGADGGGAALQLQRLRL